MPAAPDNTSSSNRSDDAFLSEESLRTLFETMPLGVAVHSADGRIIQANPAAEHILSLTREQLLGRKPTDPCWQALDENEAPCPGDEHPAAIALRTGEPVRDVILGVTCPETGLKWLLVDAVPLFREGEDKPYLAYTTFNDITERRIQRNALLNSETKLRNSFDASPMGIHLWDLTQGDKLILAGYNPAADAILDMDHSQSLGRELTEIFPHNMDTDVPARFREICRNGGKWSSEQAVIRDGRISGAYEVHAFQSEPGRTATFFLDVSERKLAGEAREDLISQLEAKNEELERFTYTVSHDLKSPLITLKGFLGMLLKDLEDNDDQAVARDVTRLSQSADKMAGLLDDLLELSRIGRMKNPETTVSLAEVAAEVVDTLHGRLEQTGGEVCVSPDLPDTRYDRVRLVQVLQNLVDNALKFSKKDTPPKIEIFPRPLKGETAIGVRDNGIGLNPEFAPRVFDLFHKLDRSVEGSGIGLSLVRRIVETHGGRIWVESQGEGRGSTFFFTIPGIPNFDPQKSRS